MKGQPLLPLRPQAIRDARTVGKPPRAASCRLESRQTESTEQTLGVADHIAREAELPKPLGAQKIVSEPQMPDTEILRLLDLGLR